MPRLRMSSNNLNYLQHKTSRFDHIRLTFFKKCKINRIDQVPEGSLMNSKNEWNYFRVPRAVVEVTT